MSVYLCAIYCVICVYLSIPLNNACVEFSRYSGCACETLRFGLLCVVTSLVLYKLQYHSTAEDLLILTIPLVLSAIVMNAKPTCVA